MRDRNVHLRVVTLESRQSTGQVLYRPEYFARLASSPNPGDVTEPHPPRSRESRGVSLAELLLAVSIGLSMFSVLVGKPLLLGVAALLLIGGCVVTR